MKAMRFTGTFVLLAVVILGIGVAVAQDAPAENPYTCSPTSPCKIGCCGKNNVCGMGPDYCSAENCISTCNAKSDCDPGWGAQWSAHEKCPLNVCCSKFGFCGTTKDFCGDEKVKSPSCAISSKTASQKVIGYYEAWAPTRACNGMYPESLPIRGYTHLNFAFAFIDPNTYALAPMSEGDPALYKRFTGLKDAYPGLETWISVGGWTMNDPEQPTASTFSKLAASADAQSKFFKSLVNFMSTYGFDGVDIDWEYPVAPERSGQPADLANYVSFLRNLKNALGSGGHKYGLTLTLPSSFWYLQNFDIKAISNIVDWLNIMSYDLHGTWDSTSPWIGAIVNAHTNLTEIDQTLDLMWRNDIRPEKIVLGIGFYGRSFTLVDPSCTKAGCPFSEGGAPGACSASAGTLMYSEIETIVDEGGKLTIDKDSGSAIVTWGGNQWVSYDNTETLKSKMDFANGKCLGGVMVWAASTDDSKGTAIQALNKAAGRDYTNTLALAARSNEKISSCVWGACNENCESGYSPASSSSGKTGAFAGIFNGCPSGQERKYCCPTGNVPKCEWKGWGFCSPSCSSKQIEVTSSTSAEGTTCWTGHRILCCDKNEADKDIGQCRWSGSAPFCVWEGIFFNPLFFWDSASCPSDYHNKQTTGKYGAGGEQPCNYNSGWKSFCCNDKNPYASRNCKWRQGRDQIWSEWASSFLAFGILHNQLGQDCKGECVDGQVPIATDGTNCQSGTYSYYCCDNPNSPSLPAPGVVNRCPRASSFPSVNTDGQCPISLRVRSSDIVDREAYWRVNASIETTSLSLVSRGVIEKRAGQDLGEALVLCFGQARVDLFPQTYPGQTVLKNAGRSFIGVANLVGCGVVGLASYASAQIGETYVTEHVLEKQMVRDAIQAMLNGKDLVGNALTAGAVQFQGVFDATGIFINGQWNAAFGNNPMDSIFGALGHTSGPGILADITNLQIFDSKLNNMKALMIAGSSVISTTAWNAKGLMDKVAFLSDYIDMFNYFRYSGVPTSFQTTFRAVRALFNAFSTLVQNNLGITYDFGGAWEQIIRAQLTEVSRIARVNFIALLTQLTNDFNNPLLTALLMPNDITAGRAALTNFAANAGTLIALDNNALT